MRYQLAGWHTRPLHAVWNVLLQAVASRSHANKHTESPVGAEPQNSSSEQRGDATPQWRRQRPLMHSSGRSQPSEAVHASYSLKGA